MSSAIYAMDFETTTDVDYLEEGEVRCYLWHLRNVFEDEERIGYSLDSFFEWMEELKENITVGWFHNLGFDGRFISDWGLRNGWTSENFEQAKNRRLNRKNAVKIYLEDNDLPKYRTTEGGNRKATYIPKKVTKDFEVPRKSITVIKAGSRFIQMILVNSKGKQLRLYDTGNKYTTCKSLADIAEAIGVKGKSDLDVYKRRNKDYVVTEEDEERVRGDTRIVAEAIKWFYEWDMTKPTLAGDAWKLYHDMMCDKYGQDVVDKELYPEIKEIQTFKDGYEINIRDAYFGGRVYLRPQYADVDIHNVSSVDCNSMHPSRMRNMPMPYGKPFLSIGEPRSEFYIVEFTCVFDIKEGMDPTIQRSKSFRSVEAEWVYHSDRAGETLTMTSMDLEIFLDHYDLEVPFDMIEKHYVNFKTKTGELFNEYIDKMTEDKKHAKKMRKAAQTDEDYKYWNMMYYRAKILMNALYGKFGQDPVKPYQWLEIDEKDRIRVEESDCENGEYFEPLTKKFLPVAIFITSWSRALLVELTEKLGDRYVYGDTDSAYFLDDSGSVEELKEKLEAMGIWIDDSELGAWDIEHFMEPDARFLRAKTYILGDRTKPLEIENVKCGGMPDRVKAHVTWDNFHIGAEYGVGTGKLLPRSVKGGVVLKEVGYKISKR